MFDGLNLGNLGEMMAQMQKKAEEMQSAAESVSYTAKSGGGMVKATVSGKGELVDVEIDDSLLSDKESLQILLIGAVNEALTMAEGGKRDMAMRMMGDLSSLQRKG
ncbi:MAG: YbaB/EbfC family nucleoid-associated protein [Campylobacterales bacterium]